MEDEYEFYTTSRIVMADRFTPPNDSFLIARMMEADKPQIAMAQYLVMGRKFNPLTTPITDEEISDITVLNAVLNLAREAGTKDIHRIIDLPLFMLRRWHKSFEDAVEAGMVEPEDDTPSVSDLEGMMGM